DMLIVLALVVVALVARALVLFLMLPLLSFARLTRPVGWKYKTAILWGGLRGAVTLALALSVVENPALDAEIKRFVAVSATGFVLFTLFVNGTTLRTVIQKLRLDQLTPRDKTLRDHILALSLGGVANAVREAGKRYRIPSPAMDPVLQRYEERMAEVVAGEDAEAQEPVPERERLTIALIALANRERELILRHLGRQAASPAVAERLQRHGERLVEGAQAGGRLGYDRAARDILDFRPAFRAARLAHRYLRLDRFLAKQLAWRFELLQVVGVVLIELRGFNADRLRPIFGRRIAGLTGKIVRKRASAASEALEAMQLQYPAFAEALAHRILRKYALQEEADRYETLFREGLLGREVYDDLRRGVLAQQRQMEKERRPRLGLGLRISDMIGRTELFAGLNGRELKRVAKLFRSRLAVPGEYIVRKGDPSNSIFYISSGAVEVRFPGQTVRRGCGEFFGELALFAGRRRAADIVALGYCDLLTLDEAKLDKFLRVHPDIKSHVEEIAQARSETLATAIENAQESVEPSFPTAR
ncbi:MAG: cyclic nucleotide-binding domain-containing protein, partial [Candidatus Binatia bacterium]